MKVKEKMRIKSSLVLLTVFGIGLVFFMGREVLAKYEEPAYAVTSKADSIEIRQYPRLIAAQVEVEGTDKNAANEAFRILAGYIFGKNESSKKIGMTVPETEHVSSEKIAMTVPVTTTNKSNKMTMQFYMPSKYNFDTLPKPLDKRIQFTELAPTNFAVIKFSGFASEKSIAHETDKLVAHMTEQNMKVASAPIRAFYNAPWTLPFLRRNEVWIKVGIVAR